MFFTIVGFIIGVMIALYLTFAACAVLFAGGLIFGEGTKRISTIVAVIAGIVWWVVISNAPFTVSVVQ